VWDPAKNRWLVEIRYPDGSRFRKRMRREREALRLWASENAKIENGTWDERAARNVTVAEAMKQYRDFSKVQHRSHDSTSIHHSPFGKSTSERRPISRRSHPNRSRTSN
jgi:hypothetical protein